MRKIKLCVAEDSFGNHSPFAEQHGRIRDAGLDPALCFVVREFNVPDTLPPEIDAAALFAASGKPGQTFAAPSQNANGRQPVIVSHVLKLEDGSLMTARILAGFTHAANRN